MPGESRNARADAKCAEWLFDGISKGKKVQRRLYSLWKKTLHATAAEISPEQMALSGGHDRSAGAVRAPKGGLGRLSYDAAVSVSAELQNRIAYDEKEIGRE